MKSRSFIGRARRLTDTIDDDVVAQAKARVTASHMPLGGGPGMIPAGGSAGTDDALTVVSCGGGGLETCRTCVVGNHRVTYAVNTAAGADPSGRTKENQDAWSVKERLGGQDVLMMGVFDGHGQEGRVVSHHLATNLHKLMARSPHCKPVSLEACCMAAFPEVNRAMRRHPGMDVSLSGSTGVVALLTSGNKLQVANLGDSRAVLGSATAKGGVVATPLSFDHTPMDPKEAARINASGGRIASFTYNDAPLGPPRVWLRDVNVPGLCMTRSFGDSVAASVGVLDTPEVVTHMLKPEDRYLILMSDGIFEFMDSQYILEMVHTIICKEGGSAADAAKRLVKEARTQWQQEEEEIIDDCTAMVVCLAAAAGPDTPTSKLISSVTNKMESALRLKPSTVSKPTGPGALGYKRS